MKSTSCIFSSILLLGFVATFYQTNAMAVPAYIEVVNQCKDTLYDVMLRGSLPWKCRQFIGSNKGKIHRGSPKTFSKGVKSTCNYTLKAQRLRQPAVFVNLGDNKAVKAIVTYTHKKQATVTYTRRKHCAVHDPIKYIKQ